MKEIQTLKGMINSGVNNIYNNHPKIDKLNVFPVPDGDTGTNMNLTCSNGFKEIESEKFDSIGSLMSKFARGLIMGARGNSGVIFSQIIKGFANGMKEKTDLNLETWKSAFDEATKVSYSTVMKPVEGTILTVIRETSEFVNTITDESIDPRQFWDQVTKAANVSLENTPNLLPALKEVGVVDSGGYGLVKFFEGMQHYAHKGKPIERLKKIEENTGGNLDLEIEDEFGYCTEAIVMLDEKFIGELKVESVRNTFEQYGNTSIVAVLDTDILKIHTHALLPGQILTYLQQFGEFKTVKVENMTLQAEVQVKHKNGEVISEARKTEQKQRKLVNPIGTIAVVRSKGMKKYFKDELNIDFVIDGGEKMNPSTNDFLEAIQTIDAKVVYIFPNDSNVLLAAKQAKELEKKSKVVVLNTKTIPEGITGYLSLDPEESPKKNETNITRALKTVTSVSINKAARDATIDEVSIKKDQYMMMANKKVTIAADSLKDIFNKSLVKFITSKTEILTIFTGNDATPEDVSELRKLLDEKFDVEYEMIDGGQEVYTFIIGIE
ncbi:dihydroxyacetone/glyceraldehyde kinase [Spiroplasma clarkii]|uniref:Dihydroxyacetone/glyceraldehyde kinase n=1 Tax=Spiroplasma clarkii TaxID=2139 RepID=A0A1Y0KZN6_9MOLU|nr:DAK2 domain-containing protein [Spiroplasma clarkii]ARU91224.1 dihydroxyacetone/glyceraldehyde kinase [Spiroplasma clarkii]ATX70665.1 dihydroxyacetone/glyceraldehyde kinase [Spiroplasma clarkii]